MCFSFCFCYVYIFYICVVDSRCLVEFEKQITLWNCSFSSVLICDEQLQCLRLFVAVLSYCSFVCFFVVVSLFPFVIFFFFFFLPIIYYFHLLLLVIVLVDKAEQICNYCAWFAPIHIKPQRGLLHSGLVFKLCSSAQ